MATYEYRCRECDHRFEVQRSMSDVATLVRCPSGHEDVARVWSAVSVTGSASAPAPSAAPPAGGCCGGACGCG